MGAPSVTAQKLHSVFHNPCCKGAALSARFLSKMQRAWCLVQSVSQECRVVCSSLAKVQRVFCSFASHLAKNHCAVSAVLTKQLRKEHCASCAQCLNYLLFAFFYRMV